MTHYLRTFEHLAPTETVAPPRRRRRRIWVALPLLALLGVMMLRRPQHEPAPVPEATRGGAPRIAVAPPDDYGPAVDVPPVRVVERPGPKLIERMLAEKFGTPLPEPPVAPAPEAERPAVAAPAPPTPAAQPPDIPRIAEAPQVAAAPTVAPAPEAIDRPQVAEKPAVEKPSALATAPPRLTTPLFPSRPVETASAKPEPAPPKAAPAAAKPAPKPEPPKQQAAAKHAPKPQVAAKPEPQPAKPKTAPEPAPRPERAEVAKKAEPAAPARVEERPVALARAEAARTADAIEQKPIAVVEHPIPAPVSVQVAVPASVSYAEPAPVETERVAATARVPATRPSGPSHDAVRGLLDRYAAAWRGHDVDTLRAIGQVTNDGQAVALRQYFANVGNLEVEVHVLDIRSEGDRATVRFTRRDTFRDPAGREVAKESPPIEKEIVTTPQGLRFAPSS